LQIPKDLWCKTKQNVLATIDVDYKSINTKLKVLDLFINNQYGSSLLNDGIINSKWLKERINISFNRETKNAEIDDKLLKDGFSRMQFSVYVRHCASGESADVHEKRINRLLPPLGKVSILRITDKQFGNIKTFGENLKHQKRHCQPNWNCFNL
jgi:CRISPR-associated endonuclease Cas2